MPLTVRELRQRLEAIKDQDLIVVFEAEDIPKTSWGIDEVTETKKRYQFFCVLASKN